MIEEELHKFQGAKYFAEIDMTKAYYQIGLTDRAIPLTAIPTHRGLVEFLAMPFGLVNAPFSYNKLMRRVLQGLKNVSFYFDNVFIFGSSWEEFVAALVGVLKRLAEHGLTARPCKCKIGYPSIIHLGFFTDGQELKPLHNKMDAISKISLPTTKSLLRSFLGNISFYRKFIPHASSLTAPLSDMLKKGVKEPLIYSDTAKNSFETLKQLMSSDPILRLPNPDLPFVLRTDASDYGLGCVLLQYVDGMPFPVSYGSRKLLPRETRLSTIEKEALAIVFGVGRFHFYLVGKEFILEVDHKPLVYMNSAKNNNKVVRWSLALQPYKFRVVHVAGKDMIGADLLSRL